MTTPNDRGDGVWTIRVRFSSGREVVSDNMGHVTSDDRVTIHMLVKDDSVHQGAEEMVEY